MPDVAELATPATPAPAEPSQTPAPPAEAVTLKDHEARYGKHGTGDPAGPDDDEGPLDDVVDDGKRPRGSRAKSKMAAARINRLVAEKNELRQRLESLEKAQKPAAASQPAPAPRHAYQVPQVPASDFTKPAPKLEDFADADDPYGEHLLAMTDWRAEKREHDAMRSHQKAHVETVARQQAEYWRGVSDSHNQRLVQAIQREPAIGQLMAQAAQRGPLPPVLDNAIMLDSDSVGVAVFLASHPEVLDELVFMTDARPVTEQTVAITRRLLRQRMSAGSTGAVPPSPPVPPPSRPLTPVRTGAIRTAEAPPDDDSMSLSAHERHFGKGLKRR